MSKFQLMRLLPKGLVIFNPAVGGGREVRGVKNIWILALGGLNNFLIFFEGV